MTARLWQNVTVRLAVALAFADASIVVLALPQIVIRLHTSISHVTWVIMAYNLALIVTAAAVIPYARRLDPTRALIAGLALFGLASVGCGVADSMSALVPLRCLQGVGGGLLLCASLPMLAGTVRPGDSPLNGWSAAAAIGVAVGPAAGGVLTQAFDWRAIFLAQAPVAALGVILVLVARPHPLNALPDDVHPGARALDPLTANAALALLSAGLIFALLLTVLMLIDAWLLSPVAAAAVVTTIPVTTAIAERRVRGSPPIALAAVGATLVAVGLIGLSFVTHRQLGVVIITLALVGAGLGLAFPGLTTVALRSRGPAAARAAKTVAARDAGLVLGLLVLTPVFVNQLNAASTAPTAQATVKVLTAPLPLAMKVELGVRLKAAVDAAPVSRPPDITPVFDRVSATATPSEKANLAVLEQQLNSIIQRAATHAFKKPFLYAAVFALLVLPLLGLRVWHARRTRPERVAG
jgi:predicted MFS family arabinose efflux permease